MPITKYVDGTNGNDSNSGNFSSHAYATIGKAVTVIDSGTDVDNKNIIIVHSGTYVEGPLDGSSKDFISLRPAGDGLVSIKHTTVGTRNTITTGDEWDITGNALDLAIFSEQGADLLSEASCVAMKANNTAFTASNIAFIGQKYLRDDIHHDQDAFGNGVGGGGGLKQPTGSITNCIFMHLSKIGGAAGAGQGVLHLRGCLIFNTGMTSSTGNGVYVPASSADCINNTFSHCTGGRSLIRFSPNKLMNNLFTDCTAVGASSTDSHNYFLDDNAATLLGNAIHNLRLSSSAGNAQLWESSTPANQMAGSITNLIVMPTSSNDPRFPVGRQPGDGPDELLVIPNKCYSEDGIFPGKAYRNSILYALPITASILPHGGKSVNVAGEKRSTLISAENISGRSIAITGPATDLLGNAWVNTANPPVGCFSQYVLYAKEPELGREKTVEHVSAGRQTAITINDVDEDRKSSFRNVDSTTFNRPSITAAGLRGRHTTYRVTTTKT